MVVPVVVRLVVLVLLPPPPLLPPPTRLARVVATTPQPATQCMSLHATGAGYCGRSEILPSAVRPQHGPGRSLPCPVVVANVSSRATHG